VNDILLQFQIISDEPLCIRMGNVITPFDMGLFPLLPLLSCHLFLHGRKYHHDIRRSKILDERTRKKEGSFCSMKITISDRRRSSATFFHILTNNLAIDIFNNGFFVFFLLFCRRYRYPNGENLPLWKKAIHGSRCFFRSYSLMIALAVRKKKSNQTLRKCNQKLKVFIGRNNELYVSDGEH